MRGVHALVLVSLVACGGSPHCVETAHALASAEASTPAGFSAATVLAPAVGGHMLELSWHPLPTEGPVVDLGVAGTVTDLALEIEDVGDAGTFVESEKREPPGPRPDVVLVCPSRVEILARIRFSTPDGLFDEVQDVTFHRDELEEASHVRVTLDPDALGGSLQVVSTSPPDPDDLHLQLDLEFEGEGVTGSLAAVLEHRDGTAVLGLATAQ